VSVRVDRSSGQGVDMMFMRVCVGCVCGLRVGLRVKISREHNDNVRAVIMFVGSQESVKR